MRILQANKFFYPKGGADKYFMALTASIKAAGHETAVFAMKDTRNLKSPDSKYFVSAVEFNGGTLKDKLKVPGRMIYSREAKRKFAQELDDFKPDIIHIHNIYHQISPSILDAAKERKIPVVMHLHDYKLICPNYRLFTQGKFCRRCIDQKSFYPAITHNCYGSIPSSILASVEMTIHHKWLHIYEKNVDLLIAPSEFMRRLVIDSGWPARKIVTVYNPAPEVDDEILRVRCPKNEGTLLEDAICEEGDHLLYFGRLAPEKGIHHLFSSMRNTGRNLHLAGEGSEEQGIRRKFETEIQSGQLKLLGQLSNGALHDVIAKARAVVFPSVWPENMPLSLLESLAQGKMVIASRVGGMPEIIKHGHNGFLFEAGNQADLEKVIQKVYDLNPQEDLKIRTAAIKTAKKLNPQSHLKHILEIYSKLAKKPR